MNTTKQRESAADTGRQARWPASRPFGVVTLVVVGIVAGVFLGRFLTAEGDDTVASGVPAPGGATATERVSALEVALEQDPDDLSAWRELASLEVTLAGVTGDPSHHERARRAVDRALELGGPSPETAIIRAGLALSLHEFEDARDLASGVLEQLPGNPQALGALVDAQVELGRYDQAADTLQEMLDRRPSLPALARTSYLRELNGDLDGAVTAMSQAVEAGSALPDELASVLVLVGDLQRRQGQFEDAARAADQAAEIREDLPLVAVLRSRLDWVDGDPDGAIARLEELTDRLPLPEALTALQEMQTAAGRTEDAADTADVIRATAALQEASGQDVDLELARFEADAGEPGTALALAERAYAERPTVFAANTLAWALHRTGDSAAAAPYARESLRLGTPDAALGHRAAAVLAAAGETETAREAVGLALADHPSSTPRYAEDLRALAAELEVDLPDAWS